MHRPPVEQLACSSRSALRTPDQYVVMLAPAPVMVPPVAELAYQNG